MVNWVQAQLGVIHTAPERLIAEGLATAGAAGAGAGQHDYTPLHRQSQIFARYLPRSTLVGWAGGAWWWLEALYSRFAKSVSASNHLFANDTRVPCSILRPRHFCFNAASMNTIRASAVVH